MRPFRPLFHAEPLTRCNQVGQEIWWEDLAQSDILSPYWLVKSSYKVLFILNCIMLSNLIRAVWFLRDCPVGVSGS